MRATKYYCQPTSRRKRKALGNHILNLRPDNHKIAAIYTCKLKLKFLLSQWFLEDVRQQHNSAERMYKQSITQLRNCHNTTVKSLSRPKKFTSSDHNLNSESLINSVYTTILKFKTKYSDVEIHFIFIT